MNLSFDEWKPFPRPIKTVMPPISCVKHITRFSLFCWNRRKVVKKDGFGQDFFMKRKIIYLTKLWDKFLLLALLFWFYGGKLSLFIYMWHTQLSCQIAKKSQKSSFLLSSGRSKRRGSCYFDIFKVAFLSGSFRKGVSKRASIVLVP